LKQERPPQSFELFLPPHEAGAAQPVYRKMVLYLYNFKIKPEYIGVKLYSHSGQLLAQAQYLLSPDPVWERVPLTLQHPCPAQDLGRLELTYPPGGTLEIREVQFY